jgi:hypothetical protein
LRGEGNVEIEGNGFEITVTGGGEVLYDFGSERGEKQEWSATSAEAKHQKDHVASLRLVGKPDESGHSTANATTENVTLGPRDTSDWLPGINVAQRRSYAEILALKPLSHTLQKHCGVSPSALVPPPPQRTDYERYCDQLLPGPKRALQRVRGK